MIVATRALQSLPDDQFEAVLAHEFGHHVGSTRCAGHRVRGFLSFR